MKKIKIDQDLCNGCGLCIDACHEGAIALVDGKAQLVRSDYCDGLGDCLPVCPVNAITLETEEVVCECNSLNNIETSLEKDEKIINWPIQIKLVPIKSSFFENANLVIASDCSAFTYKDFHEKFINNKVVLIGCPKLDMINYTEKLTQILINNNISSISVIRMEVPCCGGLSYCVKEAIKNSKKFIPNSVYTITIDGKVVEV